MDFFAGLQVVYDLKEVVRTRVALRPEHAHKAFGRYVEDGHITPDNNAAENAIRPFVEQNHEPFKQR